MCLACAKEVAVDPIKVEIEQLKGRLELVRAALDTVDSSEDNRRNYEELTTVWRRSVAAHYTKETLPTHLREFSVLRRYPYYGLLLVESILELSQEDAMLKKSNSTCYVK